MSLFLSLFAHVEKSSGIKVTWIEHNGFAGSENYKIYVYAWYWSCTIVSTVGFGDITPARGSIFLNYFRHLLIPFRFYTRNIMYYTSKLFRELYWGTTEGYGVT